MSELSSPRVSVIVPVYNGEWYLDEALNSVAAQTLVAHEVIVVDDGSLDASAERVSAFAARNPSLTVHLIRQENRGQSASRNRAAAAATGELLAFLDQDDRWYPDHLQRLAAAFSQPDVGLAFSDFDEIDHLGNLVVRSFLSTHQIPHPRNSITDWIGSDSMILPSAALVRTAAFRAVDGFCEELIGYEDDDLWIRLFRAGWRTKYVKRSLGVFRVHAGSSSTQASFRRSRIVFFQRVSRMMPDHVELRRYYTTDVLLPRLLASSTADYRAAVRAGLDAEAVEIARNIAELMAVAGSRVLSRRQLRMLGRPALVRWGARWSRWLPAGTRARLNPTTPQR